MPHHHVRHTLRVLKLDIYSALVRFIMFALEKQPAGDMDVDSEGMADMCILISLQ